MDVPASAEGIRRAVEWRRCRGEKWGKLEKRAEGKETAWSAAQEQRLLPTQLDLCSIETVSEIRELGS